MEPKDNSQPAHRRRRDDYAMALVQAVATVMAAERDAAGRPVRPCPVCVPGWRAAGAPWTLTHDGSRAARRWQLVRQEGGRQVTALDWSHNIDDAARQMLDFDDARPLVDADAPLWLTGEARRVLDVLEDKSSVALTAAGQALLAHA